LVAGFAVGPALAADPSLDAVEVKVEAVKPKKEKHATLRFLKENRDFIRARFDLLREKAVEGKGQAAELDPRFVAYRALLADIFAAKDSVASADEQRNRQALLASIQELGGLEARLDLLEQLLADQRQRLAFLEEDFTGRQKTALIVVLRGCPADAEPAELSLTVADGAPRTVPLSAEQREALRRGGIVQVFHGFVEPREQVVEVALGGGGWPGSTAGYVTLEPPRDRLMFLELDLSSAHPAQGAPSIQASTWLHASAIPGEG
jgi:hypothetical protein